MSVKRLLSVSVLASVMAVGALGVPAATAANGDRPKNVADVNADNVLLLHTDGTITGTVRVRCATGWVAGEISATLIQGPSSTDAFTVTSVPCDGRWYSVALTFTGGVGSFKPGPVTYSFLQFLVTNADTGDSAGGHNNGAKARLSLAS